MLTILAPPADADEDKKEVDVPKGKVGRPFRDGIKTSMRCCQAPIAAGPWWEVEE